MKKFITFVTLTIIFTTQLFAASKNPLKIFKKDGAAKDGLSKCVENFSDFSDLENNGCYVHYQKKITQF